MGNSNLLLLLLFGLIGCALSDPDSLKGGKHVQEKSIGGISITDENRGKSLFASVPMNKDLFIAPKDSDQANRVQGVIQDDEDLNEKLLALKQMVHAQCQNMRVVGKMENNVFPVAEAVRQIVPKDSSKEDALKKLYLQYVGIYHELSTPTFFADIHSRAIKKAVRSLTDASGENVAEKLQNQVKISPHGCTPDDDLILSIEMPYTVEKDPIKFIEVVDYGRFIENPLSFARIQIARNWIKDREGVYSTVDIEQCELTAEKTWSCPRSAIETQTVCTPANLDGCPVSVAFIDDDVFVDEFDFDDQTVFATNVNTFELNANGKKSLDVPQQGVFRAVLPVGNSMVFGGEIKKRGKLMTDAPFSMKAVPTTSLSFDNQEFIVEDKTKNWVFTLRVHSDGTVTIVERLVGFWESFGILVLNNLLWAILIPALAALLIVSAAVCFVFRRRVASVYNRNIASHLNKMQPLPTDEENAKTAVDMEEIALNSDAEAPKSSRRSFSFMPNLFAGEKTKLVENNRENTAAIEEMENQQNRFYQMLNAGRGLLPSPIQFFKKAKSSTSNSDAASSVNGDALSAVVVMDEQNAIGQLLPAAAFEARITSNIIDIAQLLQRTAMQSTEIFAKRKELLQSRTKTNEQDIPDSSWLTLVDYVALCSWGPELNAKSYEHLPQFGFSHEQTKFLAAGLKNLSLVTSFEPFKRYRFNHFVRKFAGTFMIVDKQMGRVSAQDYYASKHGIKLRYPFLPMVRVCGEAHAREQSSVPMELLLLADNTETVLYSVLWSRKYAADAAKAAAMTSESTVVEIGPTEDASTHAK